ncbi:MAG: UDP-N-acetylmuramoyl-tripeptide--D-alanyl-D-alanine ligase [Patescibacteria group bacterium]
MKRICFLKLRFLARRRLSKMKKMEIIGVTGSIGKTTAKDALAHVLSRSYRVLKSEKSYNTELGLPMTILGVLSPGRSILGWIRLFWRGFHTAFFSEEQFDFLILEMGVDKPGDMDLLLSVARPDVAVFTSVAPVHLAEGQFRSLKDVYHEKSKLPLAVHEKGLIFMNADNEFLRSSGFKSAAKTVWYGTDPTDKLFADNIHSTRDGISFRVHYGELAGEIFVPILGEHHISSILPAIGCALLKGMYLHDIAEALKTFQLPAGRLNLIAGIRESSIIDSSYNASPAAVKMALHVLKSIARKDERKIFVLGNMNELGHHTEQSHLDIAPLIDGSVDVFVTVGESARKAAEEALRQGILPANAVHSFVNVMVARDFLKGILQKNDIVLVKGSQNKVRLEKLVKYVMAEPELANQLLVRQEETWKDA